MTHCAIYIRKSREEKDKPSQRLTVQREQLPAHAKTQGWSYEIYDDGHASAAQGKTEDLKERARLEADIRAGKINIILTIELSRLSRDASLQDYVSWLDLCSRSKVKLATMSRILDPAQHSDWMLLLMEGGFSSVEMKVLKQRMTDGWDQAWRTGKWMGGTPPPPYKYDLANSRPVIDPEQLPRIQRLWKMAETMSAKAISEDLKMPEIAVRRAISDERLLIYQAKRADAENLTMIVCDWEPCMDAEQSMRIRAGRRSRKNLHGRKAAYASLLSAMNLLYCGYCGGLVKTWQGRVDRETQVRKDYYACSKKNGNTCPESRMIQQRDLNRPVAENLLNTLEHIDRLRQYWKASSGDNDMTKQMQELAKKEKAALQKKQRLIDAIADGAIELSDVRPQMKQLNEVLEDIKSTRSTIIQDQQQEPDWESLTITREEFSALEADEQRNLFRLAITRIHVYHSYAVITYPFPKSPTGDRTARINLPPPKK